MKVLVLILCLSAHGSILLLVHAENQNHMEGHIVGGAYTTIKQFPHAVFLDVTCLFESWICGSSVLSQNILLTAAHCVDCRENWSIYASAGHENIEAVKFVTNVPRHIIHQQYREETFVSDIALAYLSVDLTLGETIKRVIIMPYYTNCKTASVAGWGNVDDKLDEVSLVLKSVTQTIQPVTICKKVVKEVIQDPSTKGLMCAQNDVHNRPSYGDSGSALVTRNSIQIGLVSFRLDKIPELIMYTNITYYYKWIHQNAKELQCNT